MTKILLLRFSHCILVFFEFPRTRIQSRSFITLYERRHHPPLRLFLAPLPRVSCTLPYTATGSLCTFVSNYHQTNYKGLVFQRQI